MALSIGQFTGQLADSRLMSREEIAPFVDGLPAGVGESSDPPTHLPREQAG